MSLQADVDIHNEHAQQTCLLNIVFVYTNRARPMHFRKELYTSKRAAVTQYHGHRQSHATTHQARTDIRVQPVLRKSHKCPKTQSSMALCTVSPLHSLFPPSAEQPWRTAKPRQPRELPGLQRAHVAQRCGLAETRLASARRS